MTYREVYFIVEELGGLGPFLTDLPQVLDDFVPLLIEEEDLLVAQQVLFIVVFQGVASRGAAVREAKLVHDILPLLVLGDLDASPFVDHLLVELVQVELPAPDLGHLQVRDVLAVQELEQAVVELFPLVFFAQEHLNLC